MCYEKGQMYVPFGGKKRFHIRFHIRPELLNKKVEVWSIKKSLKLVTFVAKIIAI